MSAETREQQDAGFSPCRRCCARACARRRTGRDGRMLDVEPLVAMLFAASVAIRVLGRAGHDRRFLQQIATGRDRSGSKLLRQPAEGLTNAYRRARSASAVARSCTRTTRPRTTTTSSGS